jgi:hypothetical protein
MLSEKLKNFAEQLEARRETDGGLILCIREADRLIDAVHMAAEQVTALENAQVGAPARGAVVPLAPKSARREALKRLVTVIPANGGDAA